MTENTTTTFAANDDLPDGIPLGNHSPLLVPRSLGQSFLQPKFIYPLGAVSLFNPDNLGANDDFGAVDDSFADSPFFDQPLQSAPLSTADKQASSPPNIQSKSLSARSNLQRKPQPKQSANIPTSNTAIQNIRRKPLTDIDASEPLQTDIQRQADISNVDSLLQGDRNIQRESLVNTQSQIDIFNVSEDDRNIQRESLTDRQRQANVPVVSEGDRNIQREYLTDTQSQADISDLNLVVGNINR